MQAAKVLSLLSGLGMVVALWSMGRTLAGEQAGRAAGAVAATAPLLVNPALLGGGDALALALAWAGVALTWNGALRWRFLGHFSSGNSGALFGRSMRRYGLQIVVGCALLGLSVAAKPVALPSFFLLLVVPIFGGRRVLLWLLPGLVVAAALASPF